MEIITKKGAIQNLRPKHRNFGMVSSFVPLTSRALRGQANDADRHYPPRSRALRDLLASGLRHRLDQVFRGKCHHGDGCA
jgi:hypothetical protein